MIDVVCFWDVDRDGLDLKSDIEGSSNLSLKKTVALWSGYFGFDPEEAESWKGSRRVF